MYPWLSVNAAVKTSFKCYKMARRLSTKDTQCFSIDGPIVKFFLQQEQVEIHSVLGFTCNLWMISQLRPIHISVFPPYRVFKGIFFQNKFLYLRLVLKLLMLCHLQRSYIYWQIKWDNVNKWWTGEDLKQWWSRYWREKKPMKNFSQNRNNLNWYRTSQIQVRLVTATVYCLVPVVVVVV